MKSAETYSFGAPQAFSLIYTRTRQLIVSNPTPSHTLERLGEPILVLTLSLASGLAEDLSGTVVIIISFSYFREAPPVCFAIKPGSYPNKRMAVRWSFITRRRRVPFCLRLAHQLAAARQMAISSWVPSR